jgi:predicted nucleic acid-binding protein
MLFIGYYTTIFASEYKSVVRIGPMDLKIASIALVNNAVVLTRNAKYFGKVPQLRIEHWAEEV